MRNICSGKREMAKTTGNSKQGEIAQFTLWDDDAKGEGYNKIN